MNLIKFDTQDKQNAGLTENLSHYILEVNTLLKELKELREQLLTVLTNTPSTTDFTDKEFDLGSVNFSSATAGLFQASHDGEEDNEDDEGENGYKQNFQADESKFHYQLEQP